MAQERPPVPFLTSPAIAHALPRRHSRAETVGSHLPQLALIGAAFLAFLAVAATTLWPQVSQTVRRVTPTHSSTVAQPAIALDPAQLASVLSYARTMRPDDILVQVRPGVFAKRSNVQGVDVNGRTVYYDVVPHQSFGPLRSGKVDVSQVTMLAREASGDSLVLVYMLH